MHGFGTLCDATVILLKSLVTVGMTAVDDVTVKRLVDRTVRGSIPRLVLNTRASWFIRKQAYRAGLCHRLRAIAGPQFGEDGADMVFDRAKRYHQFLGNF